MSPITPGKEDSIPAFRPRGRGKRQPDSNKSSALLKMATIGDEEEMKMILSKQTPSQMKNAIKSPAAKPRVSSSLADVSCFHCNIPFVSSSGSGLFHYPKNANVDEMSPNSDVLTENGVIKPDSKLHNQMMDDFEEVPGNKPLRLPKKAAKVKNKAPASLQITAEQLLREAKERDLEIVASPPKTKISDPEELAEYQRKRRARKCIELFERAPDIDQYRSSFYYIVAPICGNGNEAFERFMEWEPPEQTWQTYVNFELSYREIDRAHTIRQRFLHVHEENLDEMLLIAFAQFEERQKEHERSRTTEGTRNS